jgi:hypothetical protein
MTEQKQETQLKLEWRVRQELPWINKNHPARTANIDPNVPIDTEYEDLYLGQTRLATIRLIQRADGTVDKYCWYIAAYNYLEPSERSIKISECISQYNGDMTTIVQYRNAIKDICLRLLKPLSEENK